MKIDISPEKAKEIKRKSDIIVRIVIIIFILLILAFFIVNNFGWGKGWGKGGQRCQALKLDK